MKKIKSDGTKSRRRFKALSALLLLSICLAPMGFASRRAFAADPQQELKALRSIVDALALSVAAASEDNAALRREVAELRREVAALRAASTTPSGSRASAASTPKSQETAAAKGNEGKDWKGKGIEKEDSEMNALLKSFLKQVLTHAVETLDLDAPQEKEKSEKR